MKTEQVQTLVLGVLKSIPEPYSHHIIDEVFSRIEQDASLLSEYERLCDVLGRDVVNNWGGRWIALKLGKVGEKQVPSKLSSLIGSYSILDTDLIVPLTESDARKQMSDYFMSNKSDLPSGIREHREQIISLILSGMSVEEAFEAVSVE